MEYYVYVYADPRFQYADPIKIGIEFEPIYIGKGKNLRIYQHWVSVMKGRKLSNPIFNSRLSEIRDCGLEPIMIKIYQGISDDQSKEIEKKLISQIGRYIKGEGPLLNISDGGDGGITWSSKFSPFKGKTLEEIHGFETSQYMKMRLSEEAKLRVGNKNHMWGRKGSSSPILGSRNGLYGEGHTEESRRKISESVKEWICEMDENYRNDINRKIKESKEKWTIEKKIEIYGRISESMKGKKFSPLHIENLIENHYRKKNKGNPELACSEECKLKISEKLKSRIFTDEHKNKLRRFSISYIDLKNKVQLEGIRSKRMYKEWILNNNINAPLNPGHKNYGEEWEGWGIFLGKKNA